MQHRDEHFWLRLQPEPLNIDAAFAFLQTPAAGGISLFVGTTRQWTGKKETAELEYEVYAEMALEEMRRLAAEAREQWPVEKAVVLHRLGIVPPAEASVVCGVATPHRAEAFAACRFLIDRLKEDVPVWKREVYTDGRTEWVEGGTPSTAGREEPA